MISPPAARACVASRASLGPHGLSPRRGFREVTRVVVDGAGERAEGHAALLHVTSHHGVKVCHAGCAVSRVPRRAGGGSAWTCGPAWDRPQGHTAHGTAARCILPVPVT